MGLPELPVTKLTGPLTAEQANLLASQLQLPRGVDELFVGGDIVVSKGTKEPYDRLEVRSPEKDDRWNEITVTTSRGGLTETTKGITEIYAICHPFSEKCDDAPALSTYRPGTAALADKFAAQFSCVDPLFTKDMNVWRAKFGLRPCEPQENWKTNVPSHKVEKL
jgi:hypothetical protein